jgi:hypothetical protein
VRLRDDEPPRSGRGSSTDVWRGYARGLGLQVPDDASRQQIIALVDDRGSNWHPVAREWYESLAGSAQNVFYEPSDWATARVAASILSQALRSLEAGARGTGTLLERWQMLSTELLTTEGARRRARVEIERAAAETDTEAADVEDLDVWRRRLAASD